MINFGYIKVQDCFVEKYSGLIGLFDQLSVGVQPCAGAGFGVGA
jgi:hypothetical protein